MSVLKEALHDAMLALTSHENAKSRLEKAWLDKLETIPEGDLPESVRDRFMAMRERIMCRRPVNNEHPIVATIRKMSPMEASDCGHDIVKLYFQVMTGDVPIQLRLVDRGNAETVIDGVGVPDFLAQH